MEQYHDDLRHIITKAALIKNFDVVCHSRPPFLKNCIFAIRILFSNSFTPTRSNPGCLVLSLSLTQNASKNIGDRLAWHTASRDQAGITKGLADGKDIPEFYGLGEAGSFDEFFCFLDRFGFYISVHWIFATTDPQIPVPASQPYTPSCLNDFLRFKKTFHLTPETAGRDVLKQSGVFKFQVF